MNEKLDLTKILAGCPKGCKLYSPIFGEVKFSHLSIESERPVFVDVEENRIATFFANGRYSDRPDSECMLFPSKDCRDWSLFKQPQQEFQKGDHVIWHKNYDNEFFCVFDRYTEEGQGIVRILRGEAVSDWNVYIKNLTNIDKYEPKQFKPGDAVLVRNDETGTWTYTIYSHRSDGLFYTCGNVYRKCIPYNAETKHLLGTTDDAPEFYKITL